MAEDVYVAHPVNLTRGLVASLVAGAAGAALYAVLIIGSNRMFWLVAVFTGSCVGLAAVKGAGKATAAVQAMAAVITVVSMLAGFLVAAGYVIDRNVEAQGGAVEWLAVVRASPRLLMASGLDALFSLAGGLVGAWYAIRVARPPDFTIVEKAP